MIKPKHVPFVKNSRPCEFSQSSGQDEQLKQLPAGCHVNHRNTEKLNERNAVKTRNQDRNM